MRHLLFVAMLTLAAGLPAAEPRDYPIQPVPFTAVKIEEGFWGPRMKTNREVTVWYDPERPDRAILQPGVTLIAYLLPAFGVLLAVSSVLAWIFPWLREDEAAGGG